MIKFFHQVGSIHFPKGLNSTFNRQFDKIVSNNEAKVGPVSPPIA